MATAANFLSVVGSDEWDASVYAALASASSLAAAIKRRANAVRLAYALHGLNKLLAHTFADLYEVLEGKRQVPPQRDVVTPEKLRATAQNVARLSDVLEATCEAARQARLTNNRFTAGSLRGLQKHTEELRDVAEWFLTAAQSEEVDAIFARAKQETENGELFDLPHVE